MSIFDFIKLPFKGILKKIPKISGIPSDNIKSWCYERTKVIYPNPLKPSKSQTTQEKELDLPSLQKLLIEYKEKINQLILSINQIPKIEKQMYEMDTRLSENMSVLAKEIESHRKPKSYQGPTTLTSTDGHHKHSYSGIARRSSGGGPVDNTIMDECPTGMHRMPNGTCMEGDTHPIGEYNAGGKTKPKPLTKSQRQKLIDDILKGN